MFWLAHCGLLITQHIFEALTETHTCRNTAFPYNNRVTRRPKSTVWGTAQNLYLFSCFLIIGKRLHILIFWLFTCSEIAYLTIPLTTDTNEPCMLTFWRAIKMGIWVERVIICQHTQHTLLHTWRGSYVVSCSHMSHINILFILKKKSNDSSKLFPI